MIPTEYASTALGEGLYRVMRMAMFDLTGSFDTLLPRLVVVNFAPRLCAWLLTAVVSGLLMHAVLRRRAGRMGDQVYAQFD